MLSCWGRTCSRLSSLARRRPSRNPLTRNGRHRNGHEGSEGHGGLSILSSREYELRLLSLLYPTHHQLHRSLQPKFRHGSLPNTKVESICSFGPINRRHLSEGGGHEKCRICSPSSPMRKGENFSIAYLVFGKVGSAKWGQSMKD